MITLEIGIRFSTNGQVDVNGNTLGDVGIGFLTSETNTGFHMFKQMVLSPHVNDDGLISSGIVTCYRWFCSWYSLCTTSVSTVLRLLNFVGSGNTFAYNALQIQLTLALLVVVVVDQVSQRLTPLFQLLIQLVLVHLQLHPSGLLQSSHKSIS